MKNVEHAYAIVRVDSPFAPEKPGTPGGGFFCSITIKEVVWTMEEAVEEVQRLNELNKDKGCYYFWQVTRVKNKTQESSAIPWRLSLDIGPCPECGEMDYHTADCLMNHLGQRR